MEKLLADMRQMARRSEMKIESSVEVPVTPVDFKRILRRLMNNPRNQAMVYDVFHKFHRDRFWIANVIDKWFQCEKMMLEGEVRIQKKMGSVQSSLLQIGVGFFCFTNSKGTAHEIIHAPYASKHRMVYSNNIQEN